MNIPDGRLLNHGGSLNVMFKLNIEVIEVETLELIRNCLSHRHRHRISIRSCKGMRSRSGSCSCATCKGNMLDAGKQESKMNHAKQSQDKNGKPHDEFDGFNGAATSSPSPVCSLTLEHVHILNVGEGG